MPWQGRDRLVAVVVAVGVGIVVVLVVVVEFGKWNDFDFW